MAHKLPDVWAARDFPILKAATEAIDEGGRPTIDDLGKATRLSPDEVQRGVKALERRGLVVVRETAQGWGVTLLVDSRYQEGTTRRNVTEAQEVHPGVQG